MIYQQVRSVSPGALRFIRLSGDARITLKSFEYYRDGGVGVLLECRDDRGRLLGISFADSQGKNSITVVRGSYRNQGIGTELLERKNELLHGRLVSVVAVNNEPSVRMCEKVLPLRERKDSKYIFRGAGCVV